VQRAIFQCIRGAAAKAMPDDGAGVMQQDKKDRKDEN